MEEDFSDLLDNVIAQEFCPTPPSSLNADFAQQRDGLSNRFDQMHSNQTNEWVDQAYFDSNSKTLVSRCDPDPVGFPNPLALESSSSIWPFLGVRSSASLSTSHTLIFFVSKPRIT